MQCWKLFFANNINYGNTLFRHQHDKDKYRLDISKQKSLLFRFQENAQLSVNGHGNCKIFHHQFHYKLLDGIIGKPGHHKKFLRKNKIYHILSSPDIEKVQVVEIFLHGRQGAICPRYNTMATNDLPVQEASNCGPTLIARFMGLTWGPSGADRAQVGPMLAPWTLLFG